MVLYKSGYNGGFIMIEAPIDGHFIQLSKYIKSKGKMGLQLDFPLADWSRTLFPKLISLLEDNAIPFIREKTSTETVPEFLTVDFNRDVSVAAKVIVLILKEVFALDDTKKISLYYNNVSVRDEWIRS